MFCPHRNVWYSSQEPFHAFLQRFVHTTIDRILSIPIHTYTRTRKEHHKQQTRRSRKVKQRKELQTERLSPFAIASSRSLFGVYAKAATTSYNTFDVALLITISRTRTQTQARTKRIPTNQQTTNNKQNRQKKESVTHLTIKSIFQMLLLY